MRFENDDLMSPVELSSTTGIPTKTLANWRAERKGPPFLKLGKRVFYRRVSFARWIEQSERKINVHRK